MIAAIGALKGAAALAVANLDAKSAYGTREARIGNGVMFFWKKK